MTTLTPTDQAARAAETANELVTVGAQFVAACETLRPIAERLARLEAEHRAALTAAGCNCTGPGVRQDASEVLMAAVDSLRPCTPFTSRDAAEQAARRLTVPCTCTADPEA